MQGFRFVSGLCSNRPVSRRTFFPWSLSGPVILSCADVERCGGPQSYSQYWVCLKMLCTPINPMVLLIIIPIKWLFHWGYTLFSDTPWKSNSTDPLFSHLLSSALKVVYLQTRKTLDMLDPQSTKQRQSDARRCAPLLSRLQQQTGPHLNGRVTQFLQCNFQIVHVPFGMWW